MYLEVTLPHISGVQRVRWLAAPYLTPPHRRASCRGSEGKGKLRAEEEGRTRERHGELLSYFVVGRSSANRPAPRPSIVRRRSSHRRGRGCLVSACPWHACLYLTPFPSSYTQTNMQSWRRRGVEPLARPRSCVEGRRCTWLGWVGMSLHYKSLLLWLSLLSLPLWCDVAPADQTMPQQFSMAPRRRLMAVAPLNCMDDSQDRADHQRLTDRR